MKSWILLLVLSTPGTPDTEHYVSIVAPDKQACLNMRDRYFTYGETYTGRGDESEKTTMFILKKRCVAGDVKG